MSYEATSPYGPIRNTTWKCEDCCLRKSKHDPADAGHDAIRAEAVEHLQVTGHYVTVARGTLEMIIPLATQEHS